MSDSYAEHSILLIIKRKNRADDSWRNIRNSYDIFLRKNYLNFHLELCLCIVNKKITIIDDPNRGIKIEITDTQDGKPVTRTYQEKNINELQKKSPEAYKIYKKYSQYTPSTR